MVFLLLNIYILTSNYLLADRIGIKQIPEKLLSSFVFFCSQVVLTQLILGITGNLTLSFLIVLNLIISSSVLLYAANKKDSLSVIKNDFYQAIAFFRHTYSSYYNVILTLLLILVTIWISLSSVLLPPRGVDDLVYHLAPIYEFIINKEIFLLPIKYRKHLAMPLNADFLFMWPTIFFHSVKGVGLVQYSVLVFGLPVLYLLARLLKINKKTALFISLLFIFTPVVLLQSGSGYIDLTVSMFVLFGIYFSTKYYLSEKPVYLFLFSISSGLMIGMKYSMIIPFFFTLIFVLPVALKKHKKELLISFGIIFVSCCYWYIRNYIEFQNPIYPLHSSSRSMGIFSIKAKFSFISMFFEFFNKLKLLFTKDSGIGSFHGGFGIIFWGLSLPSGLIFLFKSLKFKNKPKKLFPLSIWIFIPVGFLILFLVPSYAFHLYPRFSIFMVAIGLLGFGMILKYFESSNKLYKHSLISFCCFISIISTFHLASARLPSYAVDFPIKDLNSDKELSPMKYLRLSGFINNAAYAWETLDFITLNKDEGLSIYYAISEIDYIAPTYGTNLQNRIWNFNFNDNNPPDAVLLFKGRKKKTKYIRKKITVEEIQKDPKYLLIDKAGGSTLFLKKNLILKDMELRNRLFKHHGTYYKKEINIARNLTNNLNENIPIVTYGRLGVGFQYLYLDNKIKNKIIVKSKKNIKLELEYLDEVYTVDHQLNGYRSIPLYKFRSKKRKHVIYHNKRSIYKYE